MITDAKPAEKREAVDIIGGATRKQMIQQEKQAIATPDMASRNGRPTENTAVRITKPKPKAKAKSKTGPESTPEQKVVARSRASNSTSSTSIPIIKDGKGKGGKGRGK